MKVDPADETIRLIGKRIRARRKQMGLTLNSLSERTGVSVSMLSMLERGLAGGSIGTLVAVSSVLGVQMRDLFETGDDGVTSPVTRLVDQTVVEMVEGVHRRISHDAREHGLEIVVNEYAPGTSSNDKPSHHEGVEYGVVIEGSLVVELGDRRFELQVGDAIHYESTVPHRIANVDGDVARAVWVNLRKA